MAKCKKPISFLGPAIYTTGKRQSRNLLSIWANLHDLGREGGQFDRNKKNQSPGHKTGSTASARQQHLGHIYRIDQRLYFFIVARTSIEPGGVAVLLVGIAVMSSILR